MPTDTPSPEARAAALVHSIVARNGVSMTAERLAPLIQALTLDFLAGDVLGAAVEVAEGLTVRHSVTASARDVYSAEPTTSPMPESRRPAHVLMISADEGGNYANFLAASGFPVSAAKNAADGLAQAITLLPDLIVLDSGLDVDLVPTLR